MIKIDLEEEVSKFIKKCPKDVMAYEETGDVLVAFHEQLSESGIHTRISAIQFYREMSKLGYIKRRTRTGKYDRYVFDGFTLEGM